MQFFLVEVFWRALGRAHVFEINCNGFHRVNQKRPFKKLRTFLLIFANLRVFNKVSKIKSFDQFVPQLLVTF